MPKGLQRYYGREDLHFLTFSCYRRLPRPGTVPASVPVTQKPQGSKTRRARAGQLRLPSTRGGKSLPRFWQPRFYDFNLFSARKKREKLECMHVNPVTRGLVQHPKDWPWSSFPFYAKEETRLVLIDPVD